MPPWRSASPPRISPAPASTSDRYWSLAPRTAPRASCRSSCHRCRHHETDHRFGTSETLQLFHQAGQRGIRGGRAKHDQDFLPDIAQKFENAEPGPPGDDAEDSEDEDGAGQIECADQLRERPERADAESADGESYRSEGADRRQPHHDIGRAEYQACSGIDKILDRSAALAKAGKQ